MDLLEHIPTWFPVATYFAGFLIGVCVAKGMNGE